MFCMVLWCLWRNRNEVLWNGKVQQPASLLNLAGSFLHQWTVAQGSLVYGSLPGADEGLFRWVKPRPGFFKCNFDGAIFSGSNRLGFGWVVRDDSGSLVAAGQGSLAGPSNPELAEALGCKEALSWLKARSMSKVVIESDAFNLVQALNSTVSYPGPLGLVLDDCKELCLAIDVSRIRFVRRSANQVAHCLARASDSVSVAHVWEGSPPNFLCRSLLFDLQ